MNEPEPQLIVRHVDDLQWHEVRSQQIGDRRTSVWNRFVDITEDRTVAYTRYDAGVMLPSHSHHSDEVIYIIEGEVTVGGQSLARGHRGGARGGQVLRPVGRRPRRRDAVRSVHRARRPSGAGSIRLRRTAGGERLGRVPQPPFTLPPLRSRGDATAG